MEGAPQRLTLELTESAPIADLARAAVNARILRRSGIRLALDDFGVGFSTATRLAWIECDELKIDRAVVRGMEHCDEQCYLVEHLLTLAHAHGMTACAEGVETEAALQMLGALGCVRVQGYLIARPVEARAIPALNPRVVCPQHRLATVGFGADEPARAGSGCGCGHGVLARRRGRWQRLS